MSAFLCLASVGRSGSTFLQRLLNTHPDIVLFGEHEGFLRGLRDAYSRLAAPRTVALLKTGRSQLDAILSAEPVTDTPGGWSIEWTNAMRPADITPAFAQFVKDLIYPPSVRSSSHRYWGFKEIRYGADELRFLKAIFPEARFLVLARDPLAVYRSQCRLEWGREAGAEQAAAEFHRDFSALADAWDALREPVGTDGHARLVCYERLVADPVGQLDLIARWLNVAPFDEGKILAVAAAQMTPQRERWTAEAEAFLDTYRATHADADLQRYFVMRRDAIASGTDRGDPAPRARLLAGTHHLRVASATGAPGPMRRSVRRKLIFQHIPMTGGTTLREQISMAFDSTEICPYRFGLPKECSAEELEGYRFFSGSFTPEEIHRIPGEKYVFTVLREPRERLLSLLKVSDRHVLLGDGPLLARSGSVAGRTAPPYQDTRLASLYQALDNGMARQLAGSVGVASDGTYLREEGDARRPITGMEVVGLAAGNLCRLDLVGFTDELDTVYARVAHEFGLPQASGTLPRRGAPGPEGSPAGSTGTDVSASFEQQLNRLTELDRQVFALARSRPTPLTDLRAAPAHAEFRPAGAPTRRTAGEPHPGKLLAATPAAVAE